MMSEGISFSISEEKQKTASRERTPGSAQRVHEQVRDIALPAVEQLTDLNGKGIDTREKNHICQIPVFLPDKGKKEAQGHEHKCV